MKVSHIVASVLISCISLYAAGALQQWQPNQVAPAQAPSPQQITLTQDQLQQLMQQIAAQCAMIPQVPFAQRQQQPSVVVNCAPSTMVSQGSSSSSVPLVPPAQEQPQPSEQRPSFFEQSYERFLQLKYPLAGSAAACLYGLIEYRMWIAQSLLNDKQSWGRWKGHMKLHELSTMPVDRLFDELAFEIAIRYVSPENLFDTSHLLRSFFDALSYEQTTLKRFLCFHWWLSLFCCNWFFLSTDTQVKRAKRHLKRIRFLKSIVLSHIAQHTYLGLTPQTSDANINVLTNKTENFNSSLINR